MRAVCTLALFALTLWTHWAFAEPEFPTLTGRVVDSANLLDASTQAQLDKTLAAHEAQTSNQIVVVTLPSLQGYDIADYGVQLAREWGIGTQEKSNGVVLLVAPAERKVRIEVGYGLEGALPDGLAGDIIRKRILPYFRENDYAGGIQAGVTSVLAAIDGEYEYDPSANTLADSSGLKAIVPIVFISIMLISQIARRKFNNRRVAQAIVPSGFVGMMSMIVNNNPFISIGLALGAFALIYITSKDNGRGGTGNPYQNANTGSQRNHQGRSSGGGFRGGGGGFGGGGASGSW